MKEKSVVGRFLPVLMGLALTLVPLVLTGCPGPDSGSSDLRVTAVMITGDGVTSDAGQFTLTLVEGEYALLDATVIPASATRRTVTWALTAGNAHVTWNAATRTVTATAQGTATITATADGVTSTLSITVNPAPIPVTAVTITGDGVAPVVGQANQFTLTLVAGEYAVLDATVAPANATNPAVTWALATGGTYASWNAATRTVTADAQGTATITATANGVTSTLTITVNPSPIDKTLGWPDFVDAAEDIDITLASFSIATSPTISVELAGFENVRWFGGLSDQPINTGVSQDATYSTLTIGANVHGGNPGTFSVLAVVEIYRDGVLVPFGRRVTFTVTL